MLKNDQYEIVVPSLPPPCSPNRLNTAIGSDRKGKRCCNRSIRSRVRFMSASARSTRWRCVGSNRSTLAGVAIEHAVTATGQRDAIHAAAERRLAKVGQRHTRLRRDILDLVVAAAGPVTVPELMSRDNGPRGSGRVAQSSLYRNLVVLEDVGVLQRVAGWGTTTASSSARASAGTITTTSSARRADRCRTSRPTTGSSAPSPSRRRRSPTSSGSRSPATASTSTGCARPASEEPSRLGGFTGYRSRRLALEEGAAASVATGRPCDHEVD